MSQKLCVYSVTDVSVIFDIVCLLLHGKVTALCLGGDYGHVIYVIQKQEINNLTLLAVFILVYSWIFLPDLETLCLKLRLWYSTPLGIGLYHPA